MASNSTPQEMDDPEFESEEDEELDLILDEVDGANASFKKYYTRFIEKFKSIKRAKLRRKKQNAVTSEPKPEHVTDKHDDEIKKEPSSETNVSEHEYDFSNPERGMAIIINNERFLKGAEMSDRVGSGKDALALEEMFSYLGFHVKRYNNLTVKQMVQKLQEAASNTTYDHGEADCFTCAILSHGTEERFQPNQSRGDPTINHDVVFGVDGKMVPTRYLLSIFNDECCPELEGKPRLFFIQACRGGKFDMGTKMKVLRPKKKPTKKKEHLQGAGDDKDAVGIVAESESQEESDSEYHDAEESFEPQEKHSVTGDEGQTAQEKAIETDQIQTKEKEENASKQGRKLTVTEGIMAYTTETVETREDRENHSNGDRGDGRSMITVSPSPIYKDFLLMYAAPPGYFAWRRRDTGGWLIQTLKEVLMTNLVTTQSLTNILTKVTWSVAMEYQSKSSKSYFNEKKLVPCIMSMLTKDVYFRKKVK